MTTNVGLPIRLKLPPRFFNNLSDTCPHNAEANVPISLKFLRIFTHKTEVSTKLYDVDERINP
jgi:hypothetical protein